MWIGNWIGSLGSENMSLGVWDLDNMSLGVWDSGTCLWETCLWGSENMSLYRVGGGFVGWGRGALLSCVCDGSVVFRVVVVVCFVCGLSWLFVLFA